MELKAKRNIMQAKKSDAHIPNEFASEACANAMPVTPPPTV